MVLFCLQVDPVQPGLRRGGRGLHAGGAGQARQGPLRRESGAAADSHQPCTMHMAQWPYNLFIYLKLFCSWYSGIRPVNYCICSRIEFFYIVVSIK